MPARPSRIVMISGDAHRRGAMRWDDLQMERRYSPLAAGTQAALAKILWTFAMARELEGSGVTANTFCPAFVRGRLTRDFPRWLQPVARFGNRFAQSPERGARTPVWLATAPELETVNGGYFRHLARRQSSPATLEVSSQDRLLAIVRQQLGL